MNAKRITLRSEHGETSAMLHAQGGERIGVVLAHGAGADMTTPLVVAMADGLAGRGHATMRFNFLYKEQNKRAPDRAPVLEAAWRAAIVEMRKHAPKLVIGGKSMGGRYATMIAAKGEACDGVLLL